jgi:hypothetical protein
MKSLGNQWQLVPAIHDEGDGLTLCESYDHTCCCTFKVLWSFLHNLIDMYSLTLV